MKRLWLFTCLVLFAAPANSTLEERLWQHRNLGKAFYENPTTQVQAVEQFRQALSLAPNSARERLNYGLALLRAGKTPEGTAELLKVQKQDPKLPHTWFNLGVVYRKEGDFEKAIPQFQKMIELVPSEPVSHYNLGVLFKQAGQLDKAQEQFETATRLNGDLAAPHFQLYNVYRQTGKKDQSAVELAIFQKLKKQQEGAAIAEDMEWSDYAEIYDPIDQKDPELYGGAPPRLTLPRNVEGQLLLDADGDGKADVLRWSKSGITISSGDKLIRTSGLDNIKDVVSVTAGDFDNDGWADLCVLTAQGPMLYRNNKGKFVKFDARLPAGRFEKAVWLDYDHDYDLDLFLLGEKSVLLRNQGSAGFADHTSDFPFVPGHAKDGMLYRWQADSKAFDLVLSYEDHAGVLYRDKLTGKFEAVSLPELLVGSRWLRAEDVNQDGWLDIASSSRTLLNLHGRFESVLYGRSDGSLPSPDGRTSKTISVALTGVKNLKLAYGAEVEVKAGVWYQKKVYDGVPLIFPLAGRSEADTVRITWPNGLIQNETKQEVNHAYNYKEAQRLSGSCPMIWTWNGREFQFITDVLGVAPLGASSGDGKYFATDHDEYIQIPGEALAASNGKYQIRVTEELSEVSYLDQVRLLAVDHPAGVEVFTSEKWKGPPFPEFRLYAVANRMYPKRARDGEGLDVLHKLLKRDNSYADTFRRDQVGIAEMHTLDLDFGAAAARRNQALLILNGWVDWADGSTFLAASQEGKGGLTPPYLQVKNQRGEWQTVIEDMGMPDGKPKTIVVDLAGRFLSGSREIRIVTNMCVYWDEIFLSDDASAVAALHTARVPTASAEVRFRGFAESKIHPRRTQPETFYYQPSSATSYWNPTPGLYTRYGEVKDLVENPDDRFVIMGAGDELRLEFDASELPQLKAGWKRDFILKVDGWAKDRDANTAYSQTVEPLPFHAMTQYPYGANEHYPTSPVNAEYRKLYNTRPALVLIRPLASK